MEYNAIKLIIYEVFMQFIVPITDANSPAIPPDEIRIVNEKYQIWYYNNILPPMAEGNYPYANIPKCLKICDNLNGTGI